MDFAGQYKSKLMTADETVNLIQDGWGVAFPVAVGQPPVLINALARNHSRFNHLELFCVVDIYPTDLKGIDRNHPLKPDYSYCMIQRAGVQNGTYVYTPIRLSEVFTFPVNNRPFQAVMLQVAPMDKNGYFSLGLSCDYILEFARQAQKVIVQVNENMPRTLDATSCI
jgi:acyl-CoA hydrolase